MMKKHLVEGVVPVLIELKRNLEGLRHWLLGDLLTCIRALLKDHKTEVSLWIVQAQKLNWPFSLFDLQDMLSVCAHKISHVCAHKISHPTVSANRQNA